MAGLYLDNKRIQACIQNWINPMLSGKTWEGNNLHIDEINGLEKIERDQWISASFNILRISKDLELGNSLLLFFHYDLSFVSDKLLLTGLSLSWLQQNIGEYTPPSLNCTSKQYYFDFYQNELNKCYPDNSIFDLIEPSNRFDFFYRTYYDETEAMNSREIYIFQDVPKYP
jgi:hypothetical protein